MHTVIITGISGTLGQALGREYLERGWRVVGVSRREEIEAGCCSALHASPQESVEDARALLDHDPDLIILNAGQIETEIGERGLPLTSMVESMNRVNYTWPSVVATEAASRGVDRPLEIVAIGSIADGSPSPFGPVYHAGKIALHYFWQGVGPIVYYASDGKIRMRLYRPGAIKGPLAWAPVNRLNEKGYKIRAKRVNGAPDAERVARDIADWIGNGKGWVGTWDEPLSFRFFKYLHTLLPNFYYKVQMLGWRKGSKWGKTWMNSDERRLTPMGVVDSSLTVISTERLLLREQTLDDLDFLSELLSHPEVMRHYPKLYSREEVQAAIEWNIGQYAEYGHGAWLVEERDSGKPVGQVGLRMHEVEGEILPEIGYMIHRPYWRRGYATEAALGVRAYAFERHDYPYVISLIRPQNIPSRMVARALGMRPWRELIFKDIFHIAHRIDRAQLRPNE